MMVALACGDYAAGEDDSAGFAAQWPPASYAHDLSHKGEAGGQVDIVPWEFSEISYAVIAGDGDPIDRDTFRAEVRAALDEWTRVTALSRQFYEAEGVEAAQFVFSFEAPAHAEGCDAGFTHPENTIAHAFTGDSRCMAGVVHFNAGLEWYADGSNRFGTYDVRSAVLHETGHLLGLPHFATPGHIMFHEYVGVVRRLTEAEGGDALCVIEGGMCEQSYLP